MKDKRRSVTTLYHKTLQYFKEDKTPAIVFGTYETGLGVGRSLGRQGVPVIGIDFKTDIGFYSRYITPFLSPHPINEETAFLSWLTDSFEKMPHKIPIFITSDDYLKAISKNKSYLSGMFHFNLVDDELLQKITDKFQQNELASEIGIEIPLTIALRSARDLQNFDFDALKYPVLIKGLDVTTWRSVISGSIKGIKVEDRFQLATQMRSLLDRKVELLVQEIIQGPDTNHYKYCSYIDRNGIIQAEFMLQKIRQTPIHFGVGAVVTSTYLPDLLLIGRQMLTGMNYRGVGSVEFKVDSRDGKMKLIELNPRYWQQNYLATACGVNFPYINYCDLLNKPFKKHTSYTQGVKWVNRYMDFASFIGYNREGQLSFRSWRKSLKGKKIYSDFTFDDPIPSLYEIRFGARLVRLPRFFYNMFRSWHNSK